MMNRIAAVLLAALAGPALAQDRANSVEQVDTPQGSVTIVRPAPRAPTPPGPQVNPDPVPPPPQTPFLGDQDGRRNFAPSTSYPPPAYSPYVVGPPIVIIERRRPFVQQTPDPRRFDGVGPVPPLVPYTPRTTTPGAPLQSRDGFGRPLPSPRYPPNQYGPGAVPGTVPLPDTTDIIILRR